MFAYLLCLITLLVVVPYVDAQQRSTLMNEDASICNPRLVSTSQTNLVLTNLMASTSNPDCDTGNHVILITPGTWVISSNLTIADRFAINVPQGAQFSISGGVTLTLDCSKIIAGDYQIFSGSGSVACTSSPSGGFPVAWTGAVADGSTNDTTAINNAILALPTAGGTVYFTPGTYAIGAEILVGETTDNVYLRGQGRNTTLQASAGSFGIIHFAGSHGGVSGMTLDCNSQASSSALRVSPEDETQTTTLDHVEFNVFQDLFIVNCTDGIYMQTGPDVGGTDSGTFYNLFQHIQVHNSVRGMYMIDHATDPSVSQVNRNNFVDMRFACVGASNCNTGIHIGGASTNTFYGVHFEGIQNGTSPSATPTAVRIEGQSNAAADNNENIFFGSMFEANTRDVDVLTSNANSNGFIGGNPDPSEVQDNGTSTRFMGTNQFIFVPIAYDSSTGRVDINATNGVQVIGTAHNRLAVNNQYAASRFDGSSLLSVAAPNSDFGFPISVFGDSLNRGIAILSTDFDAANDIGTAIRISDGGGSSHFVSTTSGTLNGTPTLFASNGIGFVSALFASLSTPANGTVLYCSDCTPNTAPCTGSGTGAIAKRLNGAWDCR